MNRKTKTGATLFLTLAIAACGGGGGGSGPTPTPDPVVDDDARREVLASLGEQLILPALRELDTEAENLASRVDALAAAPNNATQRTEAQAAWRATMAKVQRAEVFQIGPAAQSMEAGGQDLRDQIYAYPNLNLCGIHQAAYADTAVTAATPIDRTGMGSLEYLLFDDVENLACPAPEGVDGKAKRAQYAARLARRVAAVALQLRDAWEPTGGNFLNQFATAGAGSTVYDMPQDALDAVSTAVFYLEKETKDRKIANPIGIGATKLPPCTTTSCPERVESRYAKISGVHAGNNLRAARALFSGAPGGKGLNTLLEGVDRADLATKILAQIDTAIAASDALEADFESKVAAIPSRDACINATGARTGEPEVCAFHGKIDAATDTLRVEITSVLNLRIPDSAAGDND
ncbi:MAG: imelysin family protein [Pseudomonadota bacterium]|nr:imelysin family protein [Pseudomonadota bacterium]